VAESGNESHAARALCHSSLEGDRCASHVVRESIEVARHAASAAIEHVGGAVKAERLVGAPVISDVGPPIGSLRMATVRYLFETLMRHFRSIKLSGLRLPSDGDRRSLCSRKRISASGSAGPVPQRIGHCPMGRCRNREGGIVWSSRSKT